MPKNTQGGNKHKSGRNSESSTVRKNKKFFEDLLYDVRNSDSLENILFGRVIGRKGEGRMEVTYYDADKNGHTVNVPITGALRGRGKRDAFIDIGTIVVLTDIGMDSGTTHKITAVLSKSQAVQLKKEEPSLLDDRLFLVPEGATGGGGEDIFETGVCVGGDDDEESGSSGGSEIDIDRV